jgi:hypothetical protein
MKSTSHWQLCRALQLWSVVAIALAITTAALIGEPSDDRVPMNAALLSFVLLSATGFEMVGLHLWQDVSELLCGLWIAGSPFVWGYANAGPVRFWHFALGGALVVLGSFSLWKSEALIRREDR